MRKKEKQIKNSEDVIEAVKQESITCAELLFQLKKFPELINSSKLFAISCETLKLEYVEAFLSAGITNMTIEKSNYQKYLLKACEKLIAKNTENLGLQKAKVQIVGEMHNRIDKTIKNYLNKNAKRNKR